MKATIAVCIVGLVLSACDEGPRDATAVELDGGSVVVHAVLCPGNLVETVTVWENKGDISHLSEPGIWEIRAETGSAIERYVLGVEPPGFGTAVILEGPIPPDIILQVKTTRRGGMSGGGPLSEFPSDGRVLSGADDEVVSFDDWRAEELDHCP